MSKKEKISFYKLSVLIILMSILDIVGITSIVPFFALASNTNSIYDNKILNFLFIKLNFYSENQFLIAFGIFCIIAFVASGLARFYIQSYIFKFGYYFEYRLVNRILRKSIAKNYNYFITKHSSEFAERILSRVEQVITGFIIPMLNIFANVFLLLLFFILLIIVDFKVTLSLLVILSFFYFLLNSILSENVKSLGKKRLDTHKKKFKILAELIGGIKEVKLFNNPNIFLKTFSKVSNDFAAAQITAKSISLIPKYSLEFISLIALVLIILFKIISTNSSFITVISYLSVYTIAAYKLLPSIQLIFNQQILLRYNKPILDSLYLDYKEVMKSDLTNMKIEDININRNISLKNICYKYPESEINSLKNIDVNFDCNKSIAIVGPSGSGKSTLIDILTGLLKIESGKIFIDNIFVPSNGYQWINNFSVVPQTVFILDDTIIANISFGIDPNLVSIDRVKYAAKVACLDKIIENMPERYSTVLGERGIYLSGGQRQRIAIARAIYRESKFIIFDEATSELDSATEKEILSNIKQNRKGGIISIAHRISTIKDFDQILLIKNGNLIAKGNFEELMKIDDFKKLSQQKSL